MVARAEASNVPADEFDVGNDSVMQTNLLVYNNSVTADAVTSTPSSSSNILLEASFTPTLITVDASGTAEANGGMDNPAIAFATGSVDFVFSSLVAVGYTLTGLWSADTGDSNLFVQLRDQGDGSFVFNREIFAFGVEEPNLSGTLAPGTYKFSAGISPSALADEFSSGFSTFSSLYAELQLTPVPEPASAALLGMVAICGAWASRGKQ